MKSKYGVTWRYWVPVLRGVLEYLCWEDFLRTCVEGSSWVPVLRGVLEYLCWGSSWVPVFKGVLECLCWRKFLSTCVEGVLSACVEGVLSACVEGSSWVPVLKGVLGCLCWRKFLSTCVEGVLSACVEGSSWGPVLKGILEYLSRREFFSTCVEESSRLPVLKAGQVGQFPFCPVFGLQLWKEVLTCTVYTLYSTVLLFFSRKLSWDEDNHWGNGNWLQRMYFLYTLRKSYIYVYVRHLLAKQDF